MKKKFFFKSRLTLPLVNDGSAPAFHVDWIISELNFPEQFEGSSDSCVLEEVNGNIGGLQSRQNAACLVKVLK